MLHRQRLILSMLAEAGGRASHLEVTKWAFLARSETEWGGDPSSSGAAFYQFVPYHYGPFSFALYQEAAALVRDGWITDEQNYWRLTEAGRSESRRAVADGAAAVRSIVRRFAGKPGSALIDHVYQQHPWFTINSRIRKLAERPSARCAVYTAGYEGLQIDAFLNGLLRAGIERLIDVRNNPVSRRYGFHKSTLGRLCQNLDIEYRHLPELGIQSKARQDLDRPGARDRLFADYTATTLAIETGAVAAVAQIMRERPSVLVCMEAEPCECHRSHLAVPVAAQAGLEIEHLSICA